MGVRDWPLYQERSLAVPAELADRYHPVAYLHDEMALALAAADITVSRAGASVLGEYPVARLPSILVPLAGVNQGDNAVLLANRGAALVVADDALAVDLAPKLLNLLQQPQARKQMEQALEKLATPQAALNIAEEIVRLAVDAKR
jgi:UDP-N-acetylglucosamine--N-acetylmuramyl-(pentapeptide) pyrophosphoryl-undecaprenol N-acetylglucosamine transferase